MTRKDTILIAVVINAGLLAVLFTTAVIYDTDGGNEQMEFVASVADNKMPSTDPVASTLIAAISTGDEVDNVLKYYTTPHSHSIVVQPKAEMYVPFSGAAQSTAVEEEEMSERPKAVVSNEQYIEVVVKKGDVLEKIARANQSSVGAIKRANQIDGERLSIGQVLKIPVKQNTSLYESTSIAVASETVRVEPKQEVKKEIKAAEPIYHTVKSGDNPWKIAKQYNVKYDEILRLNSLDEEKARNLKIGDRIRVK